MGLQSADPDLMSASEGNDVATPSGMLLSGSVDPISAPSVPDAFTDSDGDDDGVINEVDTAVLDYIEFYLLNYSGPPPINRLLQPGEERSSLKKSVAPYFICPI